ncbi:PREDICTED: uncharacterized protein LOC106820158 [Priapulus caudatus]|uniref:Uncharacterized protein LOC106820158 n=1 Tax=Priapulus caudatus TaxID=37621 RepID=A0ABM1F6W6_PRICU|nr:PREDICTED: uncharacterized protein LOC106820158 [Priapulus caudatus]
MYNMYACSPVFADPLEMKFPLLFKPLHFYRDKSEVPEWLRRANQQILDADCYVIVSAEYNHSIPPALSNMIDHFPGSSFSWKPAGIVCYSPGKIAFLFQNLVLRRNRLLFSR